jgi:hypothetical protein
MIVRTDSTSDVIDLTATIDPDVLVIFDVDDVLFHPVDAILQTQHAKMVQFFENNIDEKYPKNEADDLYSIIWQQRNIQHVDLDNLCFINYFQSQGIKTLALTNCIIGTFGQIHSVEDWRIQDLQRLGYHFDISWGHLNDKMFQVEGPNLIKQFCFKDGVVFSNTFPKGIVLEKFLIYAKLTPRRIIFLDDLSANLLSVQDLCQKLGIEFLGIHYTAVQNSSPKRLLNMDIATLQFDILEKEKKWISDSEADALISNSAKVK